MDCISPNQLKLSKMSVKSWKGPEIVCYGLKVTDKDGNLLYEYDLTPDKEKVEGFIDRCNRFDDIDIRTFSDIIADFKDSLYMNDTQQLTFM